MRDENSLRGKNKATVNLETERFGYIESAVIISSVSKDCHFETVVTYDFEVFLAL